MCLDVCVCINLLLIFLHMFDPFMHLLMMLSWKDHVVMIHSLMEDLNSPGQSVDGDSLSIEK